MTAAKRNPFRDPRVWRAVPQVSPAIAELVDCVWCIGAAEPLPSGYTEAEAVYTTCADCGTAIKHRRVAPRRPPKVCFSCGEKRAAAAGVSIPVRGPDPWEGVR